MPMDTLEDFITPKKEVFTKVVHYLEELQDKSTDLITLNSAGELTDNSGDIIYEFPTSI